MRQKTPRPLRRILHIYRHDQTGRIIEILSCGHRQAERSDIYGPVPAERRRCRQCALRHPRAEDSAPGS